MPASSLAQILLRIFALYWMMSGIIQFGSIALIGRLPDRSFILPDLSFFLPSAVYVLIGLGIWHQAPRLSRLAAAGNDGELTLRGVTQRQLCATAFMALGIYFTLSHVGNLLNGIYIYVLKRNNGEELLSNDYSFLQFGINVVAGVLLAANARKLAGKLCADQPVSDQEA